MYKIIKLLSHRFEKLRISMSTGNSSSIELLYKEYLNKVIDGTIFPERQRSNDVIFLKFREKFEGKINEFQEKELIKLLGGRVSKWFVPCVLNVVDSFSEKMMIQLVETGIKVKDPSYNESFLRPATRVYDLEVHKYLLTRFQRSTVKEKKGILRVLYWVRSKLYTTWDIKGVKEECYNEGFRWTENKFVFVNNTNRVKYLNYKNRVNMIRNKWCELFEDELKNIDNRTYELILMSHLKMIKEHLAL